MKWMAFIFALLIASGSAAAPLDTHARVIAEGAGGSLSACASGCDMSYSLGTSAHAAGTSEGGLITIPAAETAGGIGLLTYLSLSSKGGATNQVYIYLYEKLPSGTCADNATFAEAAGDVPNRIAPPISLTFGAAPGSWDAVTSGSAQNLVLNFTAKDASPPTRNIYACIVTAASVTPASASDVTVTFGVIN